MPSICTSQPPSANTSTLLLLVSIYVHLVQDEVARQRPLGPSLLLLLEVQAPPANTPTQAGTSVLAGSGAQCGAAVPAQLDSATQAGNMMAHAGSIHQACSTSPLGSMSQQGVQRQIQGLVAGSIVIDELQVGACCLCWTMLCWPCSLVMP